MRDQVEEVKQKTDIVGIIGERIQLKKAGRNYKALCPFHSEKTPSFMVSPELQMYKCFGCGEAGDAFSFLEKYEGMEFGEALRFLADRAGVKLTVYRPGEESEKERLFSLNSLTNKFYNYFLISHAVGKKALAYLTHDRGLSLATIKTFQIGFSPDVEGILKKFLVDKKKFQFQEIERGGLGLVRGNTLLDKFRGRIIFPLFDHRGNIAGFAGRILPGLQDKELAKYINSPETPIYHKNKLLYGLNLAKNEIKAKGEAVVVEGELDMISSWQAGVTNAVAIKGSALTEDQVRLLSRFTQKIILALDTDFAGDLAARRGIVIAQKQGLEIKVARLGDYKDPDEAARADIEFYKKALAEAVDVWDFVIDSIFAQFAGQGGEAKAKLSREIVPVLGSIPDKIVQAHYVSLVAKRLGVSEDAVAQEVSQFQEKAGQEEAQKTIGISPAPTKGRRQLLEERLLSLAFQSDPEVLVKKDLGRLLATPLSARMFQEYKKFSQENPKFSPSAFSEVLPKELLPGFAEMALRDTSEFAETPEEFTKELGLVIHELEIVEIRHQLEVLGAKIREYEEVGEKAKLKESQKLFGELSSKLSKLEEEPQEGIILEETV